jgi:LacI family fructose operon transcriptional repressor
VHSVISDNYEGSRILTEAIIRQFPAENPLSSDELFLFGGRNDEASRERIRGFRDVKRELLGTDFEASIQPTNYSPNTARVAFEKFFNERQRLPRALFVNSSINFEGLLRFMSNHPRELFADLVVGCFDYDPFASFLPFPVLMIRQDVEGMITKAFELIKEPSSTPKVYFLRPELVAPRTALSGPLDGLKDIV